jgi:hypothetical protein
MGKPFSEKARGNDLICIVIYYESVYEIFVQYDRDFAGLINIFDGVRTKAFDYGYIDGRRPELWYELSDDLPYKVDQSLYEASRYEPISFFNE